MKKVFILLLCAAALLACKKDEKGNGGGGGQDKPVTVVGTVKGGDTPLEGVVVSDGISCVKTGADGKYALPADLEKSMFVFVSTPSGWSAPVEQGQAIFWKKTKSCTKGSDGKYVADFSLNKIDNPEKFTIFIYADPQPRKNSGSTDKLAYKALDCCEDMYDDMQELKATITDQPVYGIGLGDIVHQDLTLIDKHKTGFARTGISNYNIIGNHDQGHSSSDYELSDDESWKKFADKLGPVNYSFNLGNMHFLMLDNMISQGPGSGKYADEECLTGFSDVVWQFIQNDLATVSSDTPIMVCAHSPMMVAADGTERGGHYIEQLRGLLKRFPIAYAWAGHSHNTFNYAPVKNTDKQYPIETHTLTRVTGALWTNEFISTNGTPRGYVVFKYNNGDISWKFKPIYYQRGTHQATAPNYSCRDWDYVDATVNGNATKRAVMKSSGTPNLDDSYQMQLFAPGVYEDQYVYANIFMWDEKWGTPKLEAGGVMNTMYRVNKNNFRYSYSDRYITDFYHSKASWYSDVDLNNCMSIFRGFTDMTHGTGTVSVKDRFGQTYSAKITW
ncbi:MAG: calcineurin-like phosphoesterase C-terminal domain-containing protein [Bacteroidales bacterium]|nr:calcineurin-like phosphoesterase C-terminal domain-containing protein [Bacteroidales bacterium]